MPEDLVMAKIGFKGDVSDVCRVRGLWTFQRTDVVMALQQDDTRMLPYNGKGPGKSCHVFIFPKSGDAVGPSRRQFLHSSDSNTPIQPDRCKVISHGHSLRSERPRRKELSRMDEQEASQTDTVAL